MSNHSTKNWSDYQMALNTARSMNYGHCPRCDSTELHHARLKNFFEHAIAAFILPYRCNICCTRFFRPYWFKIEPATMQVKRRMVKQPQTELVRSA